MRIAADVGGTFTDVFFADANGTRGTFKVLTTHDDPLDGISKGIRRGLDELAPLGEEPVTFVHGTTLVANAIIERKGRPVTLLVDAGFEDTLELGNEARYDMYDLDIEFPEPPVTREHIIGITARTGADGGVVAPVDEDALAERLRGRLHDSVAVCLLHSYANPENERAVGRVVRRIAPHTDLSLSSELAPEIREYPRMMTTLVNAYVKPIMRPYLARIADMLTELFGADRPTTIMLSDGGLVPPEIAGEYPVRIVESGPAAGALAAHGFAQRGGLPTDRRAISLDMGGTTAKIAFLDGADDLALKNGFEVARHYQLKQGSGLPLLITSVDLIEIGAGGGSIARIDEFGLLELGPESAGSEPGPACYGRGGDQPTTTDANVVLGYIPQWQRLGGYEPVHHDRAVKALAHIAGPTLLSEVAAARAVHDIANEQMASALRISAAERGLDPETYTLVAFGGAAPPHACGVAERVGIRAVALPAEPGVLSAAGLASAPLAFDTVRTCLVELDGTSLGVVEELFAAMHAELVERFAPYTDLDDLRFQRSVSVRFRGQRDELDVPVPDGGLGTDETVEALLAAFRGQYERLYSRYPDAPVEARNWRLRASAAGTPIDVGVVRDEARPEYLTATTLVTFPVDGELRELEAEVHWRAGLTEGASGAGPALLMEKHTTAVVPPGWTWSVRADKALLLVDPREVAR